MSDAKPSMRQVDEACGRKFTAFAVYDDRQLTGTIFMRDGLAKAYQSAELVVGAYISWRKAAAVLFAASATGLPTRRVTGTGRG